MSNDKEVTFETLSARIHPQDLDKVRSAFSATRAILGAYETSSRVLTGYDVRWISARGKGSDSGIVDATMSGIFLDVTQRKQAEEAHELIAGEMSHRVKNLLAIATHLTEITSRSAATAEEMARELSHRLTALGRVHDLVQPAAGQRAKRDGRALLGDMLTILLAPYDDIEAVSARIRVSVLKVGVGESTATMLAMIVHGWLRILSSTGLWQGQAVAWMYLVLFTMKTQSLSGLNAEELRSRLLLIQRATE